MIDVIAQLVFACIDDFPVHTYAHWFASFARINPPDCVECPLAFQGTPFIPAETPIIVRVHDCEHSPRKWNSPECVAVANTPVQKDRKNQNPFNRLRDVNDNLNTLPRDGISNIKNQISKLYIKMQNVAAAGTALSCEYSGYKVTYPAVLGDSVDSGNVLIFALSFCFLHFDFYFAFRQGQKGVPSIIGRTCAFDAKIYKIVGTCFAVNACVVWNKKIFKILIFSSQLPALLVEKLTKFYLF